MGYILFLDDVRDPPCDRGGKTWVIARSYEEACHVVRTSGFPLYVSFDHDLSKTDDDPGRERTGYDFAKYLVALDLDAGVMPADFEYAVHSANPVGAANIRAYLDGYLRSKSLLFNQNA